MREVALGDKQYLKKSADRKAQNSKAAFCSAHRTDLCFAIYRFSEIVFITSRRGCYVPPKETFLAVHNIPSSSDLTHNLFFSISKSVWCLTPFFDGKKEGAAMNSINCFRLFDSLSDHI